jgi:hypothetical protein
MGLSEGMDSDVISVVYTEAIAKFIAQKYAKWLDLTLYF